MRYIDYLPEGMTEQQVLDKGRDTAELFVKLAADSSSGGLSEKITPVGSLEGHRQEGVVWQSKELGNTFSYAARRRRMKSGRRLTDLTITAEPGTRSPLNILKDLEDDLAWQWAKNENVGSREKEMMAMHFSEMGMLGHDNLKFEMGFESFPELPEQSFATNLRLSLSDQNMRILFEFSLLRAGRRMESQATVTLYKRAIGVLRDMVNAEYAINAMKVQSAIRDVHDWATPLLMEMDKMEDLPSGDKMN